MITSFPDTPNPSDIPEKEYELADDLENQQEQEDENRDAVVIFEEETLEEILTASSDAYEQHLIRLAVDLFDQTQPFHELGSDSRQVIQAVAMLAGNNIPYSKKKPLHSIQEFVHQQFSPMLTPENEKLTAAILAFSQGKLKKKDLDSKQFSPIQQRKILTIAALLSVASGLNASRSNQTQILQVSFERGCIWIVADGPEMLSDVATAQLNAKLWSKIGYPAIEVLDTAEATLRRLPYPEAQENIGILPGDTLAEAGRKVMRFHFAYMLKKEPETRLGEDIEALHDMRVATRRLRAAFEVFQPAYEPYVLKKHLKGLRATGRALGEVRDLDVFMEKAGHYLETLETDYQHDLDLLLDSWREQRDEARKRMLAYLDSRAYDEFKQNFNIFLNSPGAGERNIRMDQPTPTLVRELAPVLIYTRFSEVRAYNSVLADATIEQLHALRIEFKKLRYTVEFFREVLGKNAQDVIADIKRVQDHLGDLNDAQVATQILRDFIDLWEPRLDALPIHERPNLEPLVQYLAARHSEKHYLMNSFNQTWSYINRSRFRRNLAQAIAVL